MSTVCLRWRGPVHSIGSSPSPYHVAVHPQLDSLKKKLGPPHRIELPEGMALAAVLVLFLDTPGGLSLVFTRRPDDLSSHPGEISFPGGRVDPGEEPLDAALREAREELGLSPEEVEVLGPMPEALTMSSRYVISPWVAVTENSAFAPNPDEIEEVIVASLDDLGKNAREQRFIQGGGIYTNPAYDLGPNTIWGATARILSELLNVLKGSA